MPLSGSHDTLKKLHNNSGQYHQINIDMVKQKTIKMIDEKKIFIFMF